MKFETAQQVRKHLKGVGYNMTGVKVRWVNSPFGPGGTFVVELPPNGELRITSVSSTESGMRFSDKARTDLYELLKGTNARPG